LGPSRAAAADSQWKLAEPGVSTALEKKWKEPKNEEANSRTIWMCQLERLNCNSRNSRIHEFYKVGKLERQVLD